ncbi:MAG: cytochrome C [Terriglobia bacterium]|nr:MAG: cytochrome C [Terriglobia bacterium]
MHRSQVIGLAALILATPSAYGQAGPGGRAAGQSPAAKRPPATKHAQSYSAAQIQAGESRFVSQCGFCHGRDAQGGESGPDLTRSPLVAEDMRGNKLGPLILSGRPAAGMPAFSLSSTDVAAIVAFIHDAKSKAESAGGGRRTVDAEDLLTGNAEAGKQYFNGAGGCAKCHSLDGSFATVGARFQGLALLQRMLYPRIRDRRAAAPQVVKVTTAAGSTVTGTLAYRDEFTISLVDADGWTRTFPAASIKFEVDDPLLAHSEQLGRYTDQDMHDVFAYLQSLK